MEAPLEASALSSYLSIQKALKAVRKERKGNQLGWVPYRPAQLEDYPERPADWESACEQQCEKLGIDFGETKCHLEWATGLAGSIEKGQKAFCYGAIHRFPDHDVRHAELVLNPTAAAPQKKAKLEGGEKGRSHQVKLTDFDVDALLPHCSPALFGDLLTESTKLDPNVRRALETTCEVKLDYEYQGSEEYSFSYRQRETKYPRPVFEQHLKAAVKAHLSHGQEIRLVPYKLNIYGEGDFFKPHTDTPVNPGLFIGTVVVCLPSQFSGGELLVSHGDTCQTFDFAAKSGEPGLYQFATFYGDCLHEIRPVTKGRRVTLTYHVLRKEAGEGQEDGDDVYYPPEDGKVEEFPVPSGDAVPEKLQADLTSELRALSELGYPHVGFLLQHEYTMSGLSPEGLKGSDQFLFDLVSRAWRCRFLPVLVVDEAHEDVGDDRYIENSCFSRNVYAFTKQDFNYYTGALDAKPDHALKSAVPFMWYGPELPGRILDEHHSAGGHQGNHAEPSEDQTVYLQSAMLVDLSCKT